MGFQQCFLAFLLTFIWASANPVKRQTDHVMVEFTLLTSYTPECLAGLSLESTSINVEYRLVQRNTQLQPEGWVLGRRVPMNISGDDNCQTMIVTIEDIMFPENTHFIQFRLVQHEHGGGDCNCWSVDNFVLRGDTEEHMRELVLNETCDNTSMSLGQANMFTTCDQMLLAESDSTVTFCGGSASVPRGIVTVPYLRNPESNAAPCDELEGESVVIDSRGGPVITGCPSYPRLNIAFALDLLNDGSSVEPCIGPQNFDAGVELSISNNGLWVPLLYFAPSNERIDSYNIAIDRESEQGLLVNIRGYTVPVILKANSNRFNLGVSLCEDFLQEGAQVRWLQTAAFTQNATLPANDQQNWQDVWLLDDVTVTLGFNDSHSVVLMPDTFDGQTTINTNYWNEPVRNGMITPECSTMDGGEAIVFGTLCTTPGCGSGEQTIASRSVTTSPLSFDKLLGRVVPTTTSPPDPITQTTTNSTTPPATTLDQFDIAIQEELLAIKQDIRRIILNDSQLAEILDLPPDESVRSLVNVIEEREEIDETVIAFLLGSVVRRARAENVSDPEEFSEAIHSIGNTLLEETVEREQPSTVAGASILTIFEELGAFLVDTDMELGSDEDQIQFVAQRYRDNGEDEDEDIIGVSVNDHSIRVPAGLLRRLMNGTAGPGGPMRVHMVSSFYENMSGLLPANKPGQDGFELASPVLATSLRCDDELCDIRNSAIPNTFTIIVAHSEHVQARMANDNASVVQCVFWEFIQISDSPLVSGRWDTNGCERNDLLSDSTQTVCQCTHLTNFAILLSAQPLPLPAGVALSLSIIGYIGVSLSVIAMLATIAALAFLKSLWSLRNFVHINLCVSLILSQLTFVIGVTPYGGEGVVGPGCRTAAVLMHYLFLVSFMWMLMEGVVLYVALVRVFDKHKKRYMIGFFVFSYGAPLLYMVLCVPLGFALPPKQSDYGYGYIQAANETTDIPSIVCWLNPYTNFVWTFIAPVLVTILVNVGFFIMTLVFMVKHTKRQSHKSRVESAKHWIKGTVSLVVVMGLTWIIGVLVFEVPALLPLAYIFTIFVAFQGVAIFIIFVPLSKQVREAYSKWWKVKVAESDTLSKYFGDFSSSATAVTSMRNGASSPVSASHLSQVESSMDASKFESSVVIVEPPKRVPTLHRQGTSFDITYIPSPTKTPLSGDNGHFLMPSSSSEKDETSSFEDASDTYLFKNGLVNN